MDRYQDYQKLQELLRDPRYQPVVNLVKKLLYHTSYYLIWALQLAHTFVTRYPQISDWIGYVFSVYMAFLTIKRAVKLIRSSSYLIVFALGIYVWQRGISQVVLMDFPYLADKLKFYAQNFNSNKRRQGYFPQDVSSPFVDIFNAFQDLF